MFFFWRTPQTQQFALPDEIVVRIFRHLSYDPVLPRVSSHWCQLYWSNIAYDKDVLGDRIDVFLTSLEDAQKTEDFRQWLTKLKSLLIYDKLRVSSTVFADEDCVLKIFLLAMKLNDKVFMEWMLQNERQRLDCNKLLLPAIRYRNKFMLNVLRQYREQFYLDDSLQHEIMTAWREAFKTGDLFTFESLHENLKDIHVGDALEAIRTSAQLKHNKVFFFLVEDERTYEALVQFDNNNRGPLENARKGIKIRRVLNSAALLLSFVDFYLLISFWMTGRNGGFGNGADHHMVRPSLVLSFIRSEYQPDLFAAQAESASNNYLSRFFDFVS
eukprot:TRINITY_DN8244_c0_g1_i1.p1 TRINITY_DN8244_c0_g1~~TRINITY_DN8244_c0_g1_i1.p1  ORF type:complete len:328 (+),score=44.06 TRINITY_DN8244_c0_g1_i1:160-1143(+)